MSSPTTNPASSVHRAQIVAEAVISAYIHEIAAPERRRERARARTRDDCTESSPRAIAPSPLASRARRRAPAPRRRPAFELGA